MQNNPWIHLITRGRWQQHGARQKQFFCAQILFSREFWYPVLGTFLVLRFGLHTLFSSEHPEENQPQNESRWFRFCSTLNVRKMRTVWHWHGWDCDKIMQHYLKNWRLTWKRQTVNSMMMMETDREQMCAKKFIALKKRCRKRRWITELAFVFPNTTLQPELPRVIISKDTVGRYAILML